MTNETKQINSELKIVRLNGLKFAAVDGYYKTSGYALKHPELGYFSFDTDFPYQPIGGRKTLQSILDQGGFLNFDECRWLQPMN